MTPEVEKWKFVWIVEVEVMSLLVVIAMACGAASALEDGGQNLYALPADADLKKAGSDDKGDPLPPPAFPPVRSRSSDHKTSYTGWGGHLFRRFCNMFS